MATEKKPAVKKTASAKAPAEKVVAQKHPAKKANEKEIKKEKEGFGGWQNNRVYHQTPITGETTTALREGWLVLISDVSNLP